MNEPALTEKAMEIIRQEKQLLPGDTVLVGVSGGADSMALLFFLWENRERLGLAHVAAAHVHHGLRGEEADRDKRLVEDECRRLGVPLYIRQADVAALAAESRRGIEETGRRVRYAFFEEIAALWERCKIATAHTASDNLETVLLHLARGCAVPGLAGIPPVRGRIIRPLLGCLRADTERFCQAKEIPYILDSSNADARYSRNLVRSRVIPALYQINPGLDGAVARLTDTVRLEESYWKQAVEEARKGAQTAGEAGCFDCAALRRMHAALLRRLLAEEARLIGAWELERRHLELLCGLTEGPGTVILPGGGRAVSTGTVLTFCDRGQEKSPSAVPSPFQFPLEIGKHYEICGRKYAAELLSLAEYENCKKIHKILLKNALNYDSICGTITIRSRLPGDAYHPVGRGGGKTLKKLFNEAKLTAFERAAVPVLCDSRGIVLAAGFGCDERVKILPSASRVLAFRPTEFTDGKGGADEGTETLP